VPATSEPVQQTASSSHGRPWSDLAADAFSFPVMCLFLLIGVIFKNLVRGIAEPDVWWHMRNAQYLLQHHAFPSFDTYSIGAAGSPWMNFEWLSELPYLLAFDAKGLQGLVGVYFVVLALIYAGVYYRACRAGGDCKNATLVTLLAIFLGVVSLGPRTLLFGWLCMVGLLLELDHFQRTGKGLWMLPPLFMLWINFHGSWVFGFVVFGIVIASGLVEGEWGIVVAHRWAPAELQKLLIAFVVSLAALIINPFGYKLVLYPFDLLLRQTGVMQYIEEWQPVELATVNGKLAMVVIFGLLAAVLFSKRKWKLDEAMLTVFALWAGLSHVRFLFFLGLIMVPVLAPRLHLFPPYEREKDKPWLNAAIIAAIIVLMVHFFPSENNLQQRVDEAFPTGALNFMQQQHLNGQVFNELSWGGYMEWNAPELKPFIDTRLDVFMYNGAFDDKVKISSLQAPFEMLDKHRFNYVLVKSDDPLAYLLQHSSGWRPLYTDKVAVLFGRTS
jgi:hypothetical protein